MTTGHAPTPSPAGPTGGAAGTDGTVHIGVLVIVPEPLGGRVRRLREQFGGDLVAVPTHVTLVPPTAVEESALAAIEAHLAEVAAGHRPFRVRLAGTDTFQPITDVTFIRLDEGQPDCDALQARLRTGPLEVDLRFPYHPHVTLAHDVPQWALDEAAQAMADVDTAFTVDRFVLFVDRAAGAWRPVREFLLAQD